MIRSINPRRGVGLRLVIGLWVFSTGCAHAPESPQSPRIATPRSVVSIPFQLDLGGWTTEGVVTHPATESKGETFPLVVLVHGNGPHDMDTTLPQRPMPNGDLVEPARLFKSIAEGLSRRGYAVARYHKRWVRGPGDADPAFFSGQSTLVFKEDLTTVLDHVQSFGVVNSDECFLYGWSEGTAIAAALAQERPEIRGIVLQGAVSQTWRDTFRFWIEEVAIPYADGNETPGVVTASDLAAALNGGGGVVARLGTAFLVDRGWRKGPPPVSSYIDKNSDGQLDVEMEIKPLVPQMIDVAFGPMGNLYVYAEGRTVSDVGTQWGSIPCPVLALQGENDASTPALGLRKLIGSKRDAARRAIYFPGLGHTLGPAESLSDDLGRPMEIEVVLPAVASWLKAQSEASSTQGAP